MIYSEQRKHGRGVEEGGKNWGWGSQGRIFDDKTFPSGSPEYIAVKTETDFVTRMYFCIFW